MSLGYGLNLKKAAQAPVRKTVLDDEPDEDDDNASSEEGISSLNTISTKKSNGTKGPAPRASGGLVGPPNRKKNDDTRQDLSSAQASRSHVKTAEELDPSIFDYDSFHDAKASVADAKKEAARQDAIDRKPKYINNLLDAAARRKQDQQVAREKFLQKEREAEGNEFADKEKFVTGAYKEQQEETRNLEDEEKKKAEDEELRRRKLGSGMQGFYRGMIDQQDKQHQQAVDAAAKMEQDGGAKHDTQKKEKTDAERAAEFKARGVNVQVNEEGQITDKRELLNAGLNVASSGKAGDKGGSDHLKASARPAHSAFQAKSGNDRQAQRERQSKMMEEQLATQTKRTREEEEEERQKIENAAKSTKTEKDVGDAKARYLARKAAKERGEG